MEIMEQVEEIDFKNELSDLKEEISNNKDEKKEEDNSQNQEEIDELEKSGNYKRDKEKKSIFFFYNIDQNEGKTKRDVEIYVQDDGDNVILTIDAYNTAGINMDESDLVKSFKKTEINKIPEFIKTTLNDWLKFSTLIGGKETLKLTNYELLSRIEKKAEWWIKLFNHYTELNKDSKEK